MISSKNRATLIGLIAILLWSSLVGTLRVVSENFGTLGGLAITYSLASVLLLFTVGFTRIKDFPRLYLIWGSLLFVSYELCFSLSIGFANNSQQAIEVSMLNYLWPTLTILFSILFNNQKSNLLIIPGALLPLVGICWVLGGDHGIDFFSIMQNIQDNPLSYGLATLGSVIWATYCMVTIKTAKGKNGITFFFMLTALVLWIKYFIAGEATLHFNLSYSTYIYLFMAAFAIGFGYAAWNFGVIYGNVTVLAGCSFFIPVISASLSAFLLNTSLTSSFWQGTAMVCFGAILCWIATGGLKRKITKGVVKVN